MSRTDSIRLVVAFVALLGLASCSQDDGKGKQTGREPRTFAAPTVFSQGSHVDMTAWPSDHSHLSSLSDSIELGLPAPRRTDVMTNCFDSKGNKTESVQHFENESEVAFFRVLPNPVLTQDLAADPSRCEFVVQMSDDGVKKNGFRAFTQFSENQGALEIRGPMIVAGQTPRLSMKDIYHTEIAKPSQRPGRFEAELTCRDADFTKIPVDGPISLGQFPTANPRLRNHSVRLTEGDDQPCRVIMRNPDGVSPIAVSQLVKLRFNDAPLDVQMIELPFVEHRGTLRNREFYPLAEFHIVNSSGEEQKFRFDSEWYNVRLRLNLKSDYNAVENVDTSWGRIFVGGALGPRALGANETFTIRPGQTLNFVYAFNPGGDLLCDHVRVRMEPMNPIHIQYLDREGYVAFAKAMPMPAGRTKIQWESSLVFDEKAEHAGPGICRY